MSYKEFIDHRLINFSVYDNERSIANVIDGFKPSQRKIMEGCLNKNFTSEIKVAQLSGYIAENMHYHHGENSLNDTIIGLAQDYSGSNNLNLLVPDGNFGNRDQNGKNSASPRYIHTYLQKWTNIILNKYDREILTYLDEDNNIIEPEWMCPIIPLVLVNGTRGIGTGYSSEVPAYNPLNVIDNIKLYISNMKMNVLDHFDSASIEINAKNLIDKEIEFYEKIAVPSSIYNPMIPWYKDYKGTITPYEDKNNKYLVKGVYYRNHNKLYIDELPVGSKDSYSYEDYKEYLELMLADENNTCIKDVYTKICPNERKQFIVEFNDISSLDKLFNNEEDLIKQFKLTTTISTTNMYLFDHNNVINKYLSTNEILNEFCKIRLQYYVKRRDYLLYELNRDLIEIGEKIRYIECVNDPSHEIKMKNITKDELLSLLNKYEFKSIPPKHKRKLKSEIAKINIIDIIDNNTENNYSYLINIPSYKLCSDELDKLKKEYDKIVNNYNNIYSTSPLTMWSEDLDKLLQIINENNNDCNNTKNNNILNANVKSGSGIKLKFSKSS